jgi:type I restriction enzyme, S subunit
MVVFPRYANYKDSEIKWIGEIPSHWTMETGRTCLKPQKTKNTGNKVSTILSLSYGKIVIKPEEKLHGLVPESFDTYQIVEPGNIIIRSTDLQNDRTSLRIGLVQDDGIITSAYLCLNPSEKMDSKYTYYLLHAYDLLKVYYGMGSGLRQNLDHTDFKYLPLPIPPIEEQDKIVEFLDRKTAEIDQAIEQKQRLIKLLKEQKAILIDRAVTKGLNPNVPMRDSGFEWIGEIPEHWKVKKLGFLSNLLQTGPFGSQLHQGEYIEGGIPVINPSHLTDGKIKPDYKISVSEKVSSKLIRHKLIEGDIVFARRGEMGRCGLVGLIESGWICGTGSILFRPKLEILDPKFSLAVLRSESTRAILEYISVGATMDNLNTAILSKVPIVIPPLTEQIRIVEKIESIEKEFLLLEKHEFNEIELLNELKRVAVAEAVTGKMKIQSY